MRIRLCPSKIVEKSPSRAKCKGKRLRKCRRSDDERGSSNPSSESESELEEQVKQRKKKQNIKVNSSRTKADERKKCPKGSSDESEHEYDDRVSLHADDDSELADNLNNILHQQGISGCRLWLWPEKLNSRTRQNEEIAVYMIKDLTDIGNKIPQNPNAFEKLKTKLKT